MQKKKIWLFNQYVTRYTESGGTRHLDFSSEWVLQGYEVHIFASGFHYNEHIEKVLSINENYKEELINGVHVHWIRIYPYKTNNYKRFISMYSFYRNVQKYISKKKLDRPNLIIGSSVHLLTALAAYNISKKYNTKFILEIRDLWPETLLQIGKISKSHPVYILFHMIEKFLYKRADYIVALLDGSYKYISKYTNKEIICIPNGFNLKNLSTFSFANFKGDRKFRILYLGTIGLADKVDTLMEAALKLKNYNDIEIKIIGDGKEKIKLIDFKKQNLLENVSFHNPIPKAAVYEELNKCDVVWVGMPDNNNLYKYGLSSNKIYDYMAIKKPIIISTPLEKNIVLDSKCGLSIPAENFDELFKAIIYFYKLNESELSQYGVNGYEYVKNNFTIEELNKKWIKLFNEVL